MFEPLDRLAYDSLNFIKNAFSAGVVPLAQKQGDKKIAKETESNSASKEEINMCLECKRKNCSGMCKKIRNKEYKK